MLLYIWASFAFPLVYQQPNGAGNLHCFVWMAESYIDVVCILICDFFFFLADSTCLRFENLSFRIDILLVVCMCECFCPICVAILSIIHFKEIGVK